MAKGGRDCIVIRGEISDEAIFACRCARDRVA